MRQWSVVAVGLLFLAQWCGCGTMKDVSLAEYQRAPHGHITSVVLTNGRTLQFDTTGRKAGVLINGTVVGTLSNGEMAYVPMGEVATLSYYDARAGESVLLMIGVLVAVSAGVFLVAFGGM